MVTDAHVRYNDVCECIWVVCIIWSVSVADVGVILVCDSVSRVRHSSVIVESQKGCVFSKSILQYRNKKMSASGFTAQRLSIICTKSLNHSQQTEEFSYKIHTEEMGRLYSVLARAKYIPHNHFQDHDVYV